MYILDDRFASFEKVSKSAFSLGEFRDSHNQRWVPVRSGLGRDCKSTGIMNLRWSTDHTTEHTSQPDPTIFSAHWRKSSREGEKPGEGERVVHFHREWNDNNHASFVSSLSIRNVNHKSRSAPATSDQDYRYNNHHRIKRGTWLFPSQPRRSYYISIIVDNDTTRAWKYCGSSNGVLSSLQPHTFQRYTTTTTTIRIPSVGGLLWLLQQSSLSSSYLGYDSNGTFRCCNYDLDNAQEYCVHNDSFCRPYHLITSETVQQHW